MNEVKKVSGRSRIGYKAVMVLRIRNYTEEVKSPYVPFQWESDITMEAKGDLLLKQCGTQLHGGVFHCWKKLEDAVVQVEKLTRAEGLSPHKFRVIKIKLTGNLFSGQSWEGKPQVAGTKAYWDGKFIEKS